MSGAVFLHYTQAELDRNFDQRGWVTNALEILGRCAARSVATQAKLKRRADVAYGPGKDELLDVFTADSSGAPVQIFVHGGAWRHFTKDDFSFPADSFVPAGVHAVIVSFSNLPDVHLGEMAAQVRRAIEWVFRNAESFGGDPRRIYLSAQSSGAHLSALALETDWASRGLPDDLVKAATLASGPYDLEPVMLSARSSYVKLNSKAEELELSPGRHAASMKCPVTIAYGEHDTDEFRRQSQAFAAALDKVGRLDRVMCIPGRNHFELMEDLGDPRAAIVRAILQQMGVDQAIR